MDGSHIAGTGIGGLVGVIFASLGTKIGLNLDPATAATLGVGTVGVGLAVGHAVGKAWSGIGILPSLKRGLFGKTSR